MTNWSPAWRILRKDTLALMGLIGICLMVILAVFAPYVTPFAYEEQNLLNRLASPSPQHWLGTDTYGRDISTRVVWGGRVSLRVGLVGAAITVFIGTILGAVSGYFGGHVDNIIMRITDTVMSIPPFFLILAIVAAFGASLNLTILVIGLVYWPGTARLIRGEFLRLKEMDYVEASRAVGGTNVHIIQRHILPNAMAPLIVQTTLLMAETILIESGLSYLGLGAQPPLPSWGNMLTEGRRYIDSAWWIATFPGLAILVTVLSFNVFGDGLRDALDPKGR